MSRKPPETIPVQAQRLRTLLNEKSLTQKELANMLSVNQRYVSMLACGRRGMSLKMASRIVACFPGVREQWLLGFDDYMTENDLKKSASVKPMVRCRNCLNYCGEWCGKVRDSPDPDLERYCRYFQWAVTSVSTQPSVKIVSWSVKVDPDGRLCIIEQDMNNGKIERYRLIVKNCVEIHAEKIE